LCSVHSCFDRQVVQCNRCVESGRVTACMLHPCSTVGMSICLSVGLIASSCLSAVIGVIRVLETTTSRF
jgi:hypothetical protein